MTWSEFKLTLKREGSFSNFFSSWSRANFKPVWDFLDHFGATSDFYLILLLKMNRKRLPRIPLMSARTDYASLETIYDESRTTYTRLLPRKKNYVPNLPPVDEVADLFRRGGNFKRETNRNSSVIFPYYAQWFSHQFFHSKPDPKESAFGQVPLGFNLSQLYGSPGDEFRLREHNAGRMRMEVVNGEEYPPVIDNPYKGPFLPGDKIFDVGNQPFNQLPGVAAMQTIMLRNHNRNARIISEANPSMDDEELFQKAKMVSLAQVLKVTMEDYVNNHILASHVRIKCRPQAVGGFLWNRIMPRDFYPCNSISIEFNVLYRWHQLIPDHIKLIRDFDPTNLPKSLDGVQVDEINPFSDAQDLLKRGVEVYFASASLQPAGKLTLFNTSDSVVEMVVKPGIRRLRALELASFNDYRELFGFCRLEKFEEISDDPAINEGLRRVYKGDINAVEYYPGIYAEEKLWGGLHGATLALMGVSCTYSGIFSSRMLLPTVYKPETFSAAGMKIVEETTLLQQLVGWNSKLKTVSFKAPL